MSRAIAAAKVGMVLHCVLSYSLTSCRSAYRKGVIQKYTKESWITSKYTLGKASHDLTNLASGYD